MNRRMNRNKLNIGTYCLADYAVSDVHIRDIKASGIDFVIGAPLNKTVLDRFEKYNLGMVASGVLPGWWGGDGANGGKMEQMNPFSSYEKAAEEFTDHPAIWAIDAGDEPSCLDFPYYGKVIDFAEKAFENQFAYINLYPNYASLAVYSDREVVSQLGCAGYTEYINLYTQNVPTDYICYDHYLYSCNNRLAYENLRIVADSCRRTNRSLWIVLQVNSLYPEKWISMNMLRHQAYTAMAFGAEVITWACYTAGWWHNQVLDEKGNKTQQYDKLCNVNRELHALSDLYMKYRTTDTYFVNFREPLNPGAGNISCDTMPDSLCFYDVTADEAIIIGRMEPRDSSDGEALFIASASDPFDENPGELKVRFTPASGREVSILGGEGEISSHTSANGEITFTMKRNGGVFVCLK